jgi:ubiquinone/menaquinone biosynthesis C-methylase UbiE
MNYTGSDTVRISAEYERRAREVPADFYAWNRPSNLLLHEHALRGCIPMLARSSLFPPRGCRILDLGCGDGTWLLEFVQWGADPAALCGIDLNAERIERARQRLPQADVRVGGACELPWPDESFDLVSQFTVFTSILDPALKRAVAAEMVRVLKPGGAILWFDFRIGNPANPHVRGVPASEIRSLFAGCEIELASVLLAPPLGRLVAGWSWPLAELLHALPFLRTHYAGMIRKRVRNI